MDRSQVWTGEIPRSYDYLKGWRRAAIGFGFGVTDLVGGAEDSAAGFAGPGSLGDNLYAFLTDHGGGTAESPLTAQAGVSAAVVAGFSIVPNNPGAGQITLGPGSVYFSMQCDFVQATKAQWTAAVTAGGSSAVAYSPLYPVGAGVSTGFGDIAADLTAAAVQFLTPAATFSIAAPGAGADTYNANAYLIYVVPAQVDQTISDDPNISASAPQNAVLPYYNASDTATPYQGPGGTNPPTQQPSARTPVGQLFITAASTFPSNASNAAAIAGAVAALTMPVGAIPLYVVARTHGAALLAANVWAAGLGTCPALTALIAQGGGVGTVAPFLRGTMQQHHTGKVGSAPQIDGGVEWKPLSTVNNNGQALAAFSYLAGTGLNVTNPANAPPTYITAGLAACVLNTSIVDSKATDGAGIFTIQFTTTALTGPTEYLVAKIQTYNGLNPDFVLLTAQSSQAATIMAGGCFFYVVPAGATGYWYVYLHVPAAGFTVGTVTVPFGYLAVF